MSTVVSSRVVAARAIIAAIMLLICSAASVAAQDAPTGAPAAGGCFTALLNVSDCLTYVEQGSNLTAPARACCPELAGLVESNLTCLCELLRRADSLIVKIDANRMLELPSACDISTPPASLCSASGATVGTGIPLEPVAPGTSLTLPGPQDDDNHGARRTTGTAVSALALLAGALATIFLAS